MTVGSITVGQSIAVGLGIATAPVVGPIAAIAAFGLMAIGLAVISEPDHVNAVASYSFQEVTDFFSGIFSDAEKSEAAAAKSETTTDQQGTAAADNQAPNNEGEASEGQGQGGDGGTPAPTNDPGASAESSDNDGTAAAKPVVLDLNGNGVIDLVPLSSSTAFFDIDDDNYAEIIAWAAPGDGILAIDDDGDGSIDVAREIDFTRHATEARTDLEALAIAFDSNRDGILDANDDRFGDFRIWQDLNGDGQSSSGELRTLSAAGITSISLDRTPEYSDDIVADLALTRVLGTSYATLANGDRMLVGDVSFEASQVGIRQRGTGADLNIEIESGEIVKQYTGSSSHTLDLRDTNYTGVFGGSGNDHFSNTGDLAAVIDGGDGNDIISGGTGADILAGGSGSDVISGGDGNDIVVADATDIVSGGDGEDVIMFRPELNGITFDANGKSFERVIGTDGDDVVVGLASQGSFLIGEDGDDNISGGIEGDTITGDDGNDELGGNAGDDLISGGHGQDLVSGGDGDDVLSGGLGADVISGGEGFDTASYVTSSLAVDINLGAGTAAGGEATGDTLTGIEALLGSAHDDRLVGNSADNTLVGGRGADILIGGSGTDTASYASSFSAVAVDLAAQATAGAGTMVRISDRFLPVADGVPDPSSVPEYIQMYAVPGRTYAASISEHGFVATHSPAMNGSGPEYTFAFGRSLGLTGTWQAGTLRIEPATPDQIIVANHDFESAPFPSEAYLIGGYDPNGAFERPIGNYPLISVGSGNNSGGSFSPNRSGIRVYDADGHVSQFIAVSQDLSGGADIGFAYNSTTGQVRVYINGEKAGTINWLIGQTVNMAHAGVNNQTATFTDDRDIQMQRDLGVVSSGDAAGDSFNSIERVVGSAFDDRLAGNSGANALIGGAGNDELNGRGGNDVLDGGDGRDRVSYADSQGAVVVSLATGTASGSQIGNDTLISIEDVIGTAGADTLIGSDADNTLQGGGGADTMDGGAGFDIVSYRDAAAVQVDLAAQTVTGSGAQGDTISGFEGVIGSAYVDTLKGTEGDDFIEGGKGADRLYGRGGTDTLSYAGSLSGVEANLGDSIFFGGDAEGDTVSSFENLAGSQYVDLLTGTNGVNRIDGNGGNDRIEARGGNDIVTGGEGHDMLNAGGGNDIYRYAVGDGYDTIIDYDYVTVWQQVQIATSGGGEGDGMYEWREVPQTVDGGFDTIAFGPGIKVEDLVLVAADGDLRISVQTGNPFNLEDANPDNIRIFEWFDPMFRIERFTFEDGTVWEVEDIVGHIGSSLIDDFSWTSSQLNLDLGRGDDKITSGSFDDVIDGNLGDDKISAGGGADVLRGGGGRDHLLGQNGDDILVGGAGADRLDGGGGFDIASWEGSLDGVLVDLSNQTATAMSATAERSDATGDTLVSIEGAIGSAANDSLYGSNSDNILRGGDGGDVLRGYGGADILDGGSGTDTASYYYATGGVTVDLASGSGSSGEAAGDQLISIERLSGSNVGGDNLAGNNANNVLTGFGGNDVLRGRGGADTLDGRDGTDTITYTDSSIGVFIDLEAGTGQGGDAQGDVILNVENVHGSQGNDTLEGTSGDDILRGFGGDDVLRGRGGADLIEGGSGTDTLTYYEASAGVHIDLDAGLGYSGEATGDQFTSIEIVHGSNYADTLEGSSAAETLRGFGGNDVLRGDGGADILDGGAGIDTASYYTASSGVVVDLASGAGTAGDAAGDQLISIERLSGSNTGNDTLAGDDAANLLTGFGGNDVLRGREGADTLDGRDGLDTITYTDSSTGITINLIAGTGQSGDAQGDIILNVENVHGSQGNDTLLGNETANTLRGFGGADTIEGGAGDDWIEGNTAGDILTGGAGADEFVYVGATDSTTSQRDTITDFSAAEGDIIDLSRIDADPSTTANDVLLWRGTGAYTGEAGQIRYVAHAGYITIGIDLDGDKTSDMLIDLQGVASISHTAFLL
ncbi:M10 family metallopeptidase C-terminal domain-containing protein [Tistrella mobilis]